MPCDEKGAWLPPDTPRPPRATAPPQGTQDWSPFADRTAFEAAELLFTKAQMSEANINTLMELWAASLIKHDDIPPFIHASHLYATIDAIQQGDAPWECFTVKYSGSLPEGPPPSWMAREHRVWFRNPLTVILNILKNGDFATKTDFAPYRDFNPNGKRKWQNFMSGNWSWRKAVSYIVTSLPYYKRFLIIIGTFG